MKLTYLYSEYRKHIDFKLTICFQLDCFNTGTLYFKNNRLTKFANYENFRRLKSLV